MESGEIIELAARSRIGQMSEALGGQASPSRPPGGPANLRRACTGPWPTGNCATAARPGLRGQPVQLPPGPTALLGEVAGARWATVDDQDRLNHAREAGDPDLVMDTRDKLTQHLRGDPLKDLDRRA